MSENSMKQNRLSLGAGVLERCLNCPDREKVEVGLCQFFDCSLHPFRMGTDREEPEGPRKAIKAYCLWCYCNMMEKVHLCPTNPRPSPFRGGLRNV